MKHIIKVKIPESIGPLNFPEYCIYCDQKAEKHEKHNFKLMDTDVEFKLPYCTTHARICRRNKIIDGVIFAICILIAVIGIYLFLGDFIPDWLYDMAPGYTFLIAGVLIIMLFYFPLKFAVGFILKAVTGYPADNPLGIFINDLKNSQTLVFMFDNEDFAHRFEAFNQKFTPASLLSTDSDSDIKTADQPVRRVMTQQMKKRIIWILAGAVLAVILSFAVSYGLTKLNAGREEISSSQQSELALEIESTATISTTDSDSMSLDWKTLEFIIPGNGLWQTEEGKYTAIGSVETIAWSEERYTGDIEISLDIESPNAFAAANIILYGNGISLSSGNLIFTVASDILAIVEGSIYDENDYTYMSFPTINFVGEKHTVLIKVVDRRATLYVDGVEISSVLLKDTTDTEGKIGLLKYWEIDEITFSNIQVKGTESP